MARATVPNWFGIRDWYEKTVPEAVQDHDDDYAKQVITRKHADCKIAAAVINKGYYWRGIAAYVYCRSLGWFLWYRRQLKGRVR